MGRVSIGDIELNVLDAGRGEPLLLVHGFPLDHTMWREQIEAFSGEFRVIAPDLRGFGLSGVTEGTVTMEGFADDLASLLDALGLTGPVTFCGLSMGGYIAWRFWKRHAARLARLILCDTRALADTTEAARGRLDSARRVTSEGAALVAGAFLPRLFAPSTRERNPGIVEATNRVMLGTDPRGLAAALRGLAARPDMTGALPGIRTPTLVVCGEHDAISTPEEMRGIADAIPGARFALIEDAGHMCPLEAPGAVNAAIREFLTART